MLSLIWLIILTTINFLIHKAIMKYELKNNIDSIIYIISFIPIVNLCLLLIDFIEDSIYLFKYLLNKKSTNIKKNEIYYFKRFSFGYCICKKNDILKYHSSNTDELKILLEKLNFIRLDYGVNSDDYIFYCKKKEQAIEAIKCLNSLLTFDKLS